MIGIITQNNILKHTLIQVLRDIYLEEYQPHHDYTAILIIDPPKNLSFSFSAPVITLGQVNISSDLTIKTPIHPNILYEKIISFCKRQKNNILFENSTFIFYKNKRELKVKGSGKIIPLTEKENELMTCLAEFAPHPIKKEELLNRVWEYSPDTETHTVETHICTLRQKLGDKSNCLIKSQTTGYSLVVD